MTEGDKVGDERVAMYRRGGQPISRLDQYSIVVYNPSRQGQKTCTESNPSSQWRLMNTFHERRWIKTLAKQSRACQPAITVDEIVEIISSVASKRH